MRIGFVADTHLADFRRFAGTSERGLNARARLVIETMLRAVQVAQHEKCVMFVVLGDVFDGWHPTPAQIAAVQGVVRDAHARGLRVRLLVGNHDQRSTAENDHALAPLRDMGDEDPVVWRACVSEFAKVSLVCVPFEPGPVSEYLAAALARCGEGGLKRRRVLGLHAGVSDHETAWFLRDAKDSIDVVKLVEVVKTAGVSFVAAGNWHNRCAWERDGVKVVQVGTLCPTGFDDAGFEGYGGLCVYDSETHAYQIHEVPGPRFVTLRPASSDDASKVRTYLQCAVDVAGTQRVQLYARYVLTPEQREAGLEALDAARKDKHIMDGEVSIVDVRAEVAARSAAQAARATSTFDDALDGFVQKMDVGVGVDRAEVLARAREYLARAGSGSV